MVVAIQFNLVNNRTIDVSYSKEVTFKLKYLKTKSVQCRTSSNKTLIKHKSDKGFKFTGARDWIRTSTPCGAAT